MKLTEIYSSGKTRFSLEVFPPKENKNKENDLLSTLRELERFRPALVSVTYGAGGSSREKSAGLVKRINNEAKLTPMPHFTCVCSNTQFIESYLKELEREGVENILALKGDPPKGFNDEGAFSHADELVAFIKDKTNLSIAVAGYPECHKDAKDFDSDIYFLKKKIDCGACAIFTQLFFDNKKFFAYLEKIKKANINVPVIPGILPVKNIAQLQKMTIMCGASIPLDMLHKYERFEDNSEDSIKLGIEIAIKQIEELIDNGANGIHLYTLNQRRMTYEILQHFN